MKTSILIATVITLFLFPALLSAAIPQPDNTDQIAGDIVERLNQDVMLTDSQKIVIKEFAKIFVTNALSTKAMGKSEAIRSIRKAQVQEYKAALNAVLTDEQKELIIKKREEQREAVVNKYASSTTKTQKNENN